MFDAPWRSRAIAVLRSEITRKFIVPPSGKHELHFIILRECLEIAHLESIWLPRVGTLYVDNLDDFPRQPSDESFAAGFDHDGILRRKQLFGERVNFFLQ